MKYDHHIQALGAYDKVVYEYSKSHDLSLVYVALSRAKSVYGLFLTNRKSDFTFYHCRKHGDGEALHTEFRRLGKRKISSVVELCSTFITAKVGAYNCLFEYSKYWSTREGCQPGSRFKTTTKLLYQKRGLEIATISYI